MTRLGTSKTLQNEKDLIKNPGLAAGLGGRGFIVANHVRQKVAFVYVWRLSLGEVLFQVYNGNFLNRHIV